MSPSITLQDFFGTSQTLASLDSMMESIFTLVVGLDILRTVLANEGQTRGHGVIAGEFALLLYAAWSTFVLIAVWMTQSYRVCCPQATVERSGASPCVLGMYMPYADISHRMLHMLSLDDLLSITIRQLCSTFFCIRTQIPFVYIV